jgi:hypothetical protein
MEFCVYLTIIAWIECTRCAKRLGLLAQIQQGTYTEVNYRIRQRKLPCSSLAQISGGISWPRTDLSWPTAAVRPTGASPNSVRSYWPPYGDIYQRRAAAIARQHCAHPLTWSKLPHLTGGHRAQDLKSSVLALFCGDGAPAVPTFSQEWHLNLNNLRWYGFLVGAANHAARLEIQFERMPSAAWIPSLSSQY